MSLVKAPKFNDFNVWRTSDGDLMFGEYVLYCAVRRISDILLWSLVILKCEHWTEKYWKPQISIFN